MNDEIIYTAIVFQRQIFRCTLKCSVLIGEETQVKYQKAEVELIVLENVDIITSSPHKCPQEPGSEGCDINGVLCGEIIQRGYGSCVLRLFTDKCSMQAGSNSIDPTESI